MNCRAGVWSLALRDQPADVEVVPGRLQPNISGYYDRTGELALQVGDKTADLSDCSGAPAVVVPGLQPNVSGYYDRTGELVLSTTEVEMGKTGA